MCEEVLWPEPCCESSAIGVGGRWGVIGRRKRDELRLRAWWVNIKKIFVRRCRWTLEEDGEELRKRRGRRRGGEGEGSRERRETRENESDWWLKIEALQSWQGYKLSICIPFPTRPWNRYTRSRSHPNTHTSCYYSITGHQHLCPITQSTLMRKKEN